MNECRAHSYTQVLYLLATSLSSTLDGQIRNLKSLQSTGVDFTGIDG